MSEQPAAQPEKAKKSKSTRLIVAAAVLVVALGAGGGGFYWYTTRAAAGEAGSEGHEEDAGKKAKSGGPERLMAFEPFVVNLADAAAARFLRANIQLVVSGGADDGGEGHGPKGPSVEMMRARSAILELLSGETSDQLNTPDGKAALKKRIIERISDLLEHSHIEVEDVLFSDFVIQF